MTPEITFLLNGVVTCVSNLDPTTSLLHWLRVDKMLTGSKEGCGEGDCGACSVVVGERSGSSMQYKAVNACILFLPMLEGKSIWTIEGILGKNGALHPVQQAFVQTHGTQCGFCTPGFVMSLFAVHMNGEKYKRSEADTLFAGNLCRCTGYGTIVDAAELMRDCDLSADDEMRISEDFARLEDLESDDTVCLREGERRFFSPATSDDLARLYADHPEATIIAGATDVGLWVTKQHRELQTVLHLGRVRDLKHIQVEEDHITIGAAVTYSEVLPVLAQFFPDFGEMMRRLGATQVRNSGTLVGNIANGSPIGDTPPALMVLEATITLRHGDNRRVLPLDDFFIAYGLQDRKPGEFVENVQIPLDGHGKRARFYKVSKRFDQDISAVCGCFKIIGDGDIITKARVAFGGMAATPLRAKSVEAALEGKAWSNETMDAAILAFEQDFTPISDMRASADYRMQVSKNLLRRYFLEAQYPAHQTRIVGEGAFSL